MAVFIVDDLGLRSPGFQIPLQSSVSHKNTAHTLRYPTQSTITRSTENSDNILMGDRFLSSAGAGGNRARPMRLPDPSPVLDKNRAPMGPEILSSAGAGVWRKAPMAFPDSSSVLDKFRFAILS